MKILINKRNMSTDMQATTTSDSPDFITVVWTTGFKGLRSDITLGDFYEELEVTEQAVDLSRLKSGAPFLIQHENNVMKQIGVVRSAWIENGVGYAKIQLSKRKDVQEIIQDIRDGILSNISVGYSITQFQDVTSKGEKTKTLRATKWQPQELSLVSVGFDPHAKIFRALNDSTNEVTITPTQEDTMPFDQMNDDEKLAYLQAKIDAKETLSADEQAAYEDLQAKAAPAAEPAPAARAEEPKVDVEAAQRSAVEEYKTRSAGIKSAVSAAKLAPEFAADLIERNLSMSDASQEIFKQLETLNKQTKNGSQPKKEKTMTKREQVVQAILNRIDAKRYKIDSENPYKQATLVELTEGLVERQAGESREKFVNRAATTTSALTELLENVASKVMGEEGTEKFSYEQWTGFQSLRNFQQTPIVQLSGVTLAAKTEGGAYADATLIDSSEKIQLEERGIMLNLSQKAIINDDLGALKALAQRAAAAGKRDIEKKVYALLVANPTMSDSVALFHATHGNLTAAGGIPSVASVNAAGIKMAAQNDGSSDPLDLRIKYLIVPPAYEFDARQIASSAMVPGSASAVNPFAGNIEVVVSSRLAAGAWYVACDQAQLASIVYGTLEGMSEPSVETQVDFATSNLQTKIEFPSGVAAANYRGIVKISVA